MSEAIPGLDPGDVGPSDPALAHNPEFIGLLAGSYERLVGESLAPAGLGSVEAARWLYEQAPFCVLAHNAAEDPRFVYANRAAQACFGFDWTEMTLLPSRLSAEAPNRAERQRLIEAVARDGYATGYRGLRIAKSGRRFWIEDVTMWQLADATGVVRGQAATYRRWRDA
jgi:MEKHLA domain